MAMDYKKYTPEFECEEEDGVLSHLDERVIHVRKQKRKGRKWLTTIENIPADQAEDLLKILKKKLSCNGSIVTEEKSVIQLQGDHCQSIEEIIRAHLPAHKVELHGS
jgi:translation initiation factor SUI1